MPLSVCSVIQINNQSLVTIYQAALERVPSIKAEDVDEVYFGNVLSAK